MSRKIRLGSLVWDGKERIKDVLHHFLGADQNNYVYEAMKVLLLGAISRVYRPGTKFEYMLILVGGQGAGKSTFFRFLAMNDSWFTDAGAFNHRTVRNDSNSQCKEH